MGIMLTKHRNLALAFAFATRYSARMHSPHTLAPPLRLVGILGGMGPAATVDLMQKIISLTPAANDQMHIPIVVWSVPQIPPRSPAIHCPNEPSPAPQLVRGARALRTADIECIAIACNTAHFWATEIEQAAGVPLLHIADCTLDALAEEESAPRRIALLATEGTIHAGFYQARGRERGIAFELVDGSAQRSVTRAIECVKRGDIVAAKACLFPILSALRASGVQRIVLGCTELPLIVAGSEYAAYALDATTALARSIIAFSTSQHSGAALGA